MYTVRLTEFQAAVIMKSLIGYLDAVTSLPETIVDKDIVVNEITMVALSFENQIKKQKQYKEFQDG